MTAEWKRSVTLSCDAPEGCPAELDAGDGVWLYDTEEQARSAAWDADWATDGNGHDYCEHHRELATKSEIATRVAVEDELRQEFEYRIRNAISYAFARAKFHDRTTQENADWIQAQVDSAMIGRALQGDEPGAGDMTVRRMRKILTAALTPVGQETRKAAAYARERRDGIRQKWDQHLSVSSLDLGYADACDDILAILEGRGAALTPDGQETDRG